VLVVDDHEVVTWGFRTVLAPQAWVERCLQATDAPHALVLAQRYRPDVALVELFLDPSAAELCRQLRRASPALQILLTSPGESVPCRALDSAGACGFVSTRWTADEIVAAVRLVGVGLDVMSRRPAHPDAVLTPREEDVLAVMAMGATNGEIARELHLSVYTVKQHARAAFRKLDARNRTDAVQRAKRLGVLA
jgi:two-component system response regulator DesR